MTTFCAISDTHTRHKMIDVPKADIVFHAGDIEADNESRLRDFLDWFSELPHKHKVFIAGNHDWLFEKDNKTAIKICEEYKDKGVVYLQDSGCEIEGIKIYGSPHSPEFCDWAFNCWRTPKEAAFDKMIKFPKGYDFIGTYWDMIPKDIDIALTHGPVYDILDECYGRNVGCELLRKKIFEIKPQYHICGHIHCAVGEEIVENINFINACVLGENYFPNGKEIKIYHIEGAK